MARGTSSVKVLVLGNSVARMVEPGRATDDDGTYAEHLERLLPSCRVQNESRWYELLDDGSRRFRFELRASMPDVVVLQYGTVELQPNLVPTWLSRHAMTWDQRLHRPAVAYRRHVLPVLWPLLRRWQRWATGAAGERSWRVPPRRFAASLRQLVETIRLDRAVVLVLDIPPFGSRMDHHLPGLDPRRRVYQAVLADVVSGFADGDVRLVPVSRVVEDLGIDEALPDGLHLTAEAHRRVAALLVAELGALHERP